MVTQKKTAVITCQSTPAAQIGRSAAVSLPRPEKCGLPRSRKAAWHGMAWHGRMVSTGETGSEIWKFGTRFSIGLPRWRKSMSLSEWLPKMMADKGARQPSQLSPATWSVCSGSQHGYGFFWLTSNPKGKHYIRIQHISSQKVNFQLGRPHPPFEPPSLPSLQNLVRFPPPIHPAPTVENVTWRWSPVLVSPKMLGFPLPIDEGLEWRIFYCQFGVLQPLQPALLLTIFSGLSRLD